MATQTATPARKTSAANFRARLRSCLLARSHEVYNLAPAALNTQTLAVVLDWLLENEELNGEMPTREAYVTQFELAFKKELAQVEKYVATQQQPVPDFVPLGPGVDVPPVAVALNEVLAEVRLGGELQELVATAQANGYALHQLSTGAVAKLRDAYPSSQYPGEEWCVFVPNAADHCISTCQCRVLAQYYEFAPAANPVSSELAQLPKS